MTARSSGAAATADIPRARLPADERRAQLLDATKGIVARSGFHAVSIEAVAREAGVSRPIVYGHFGDLGGLLDALVERESARALAQLSTVLPIELEPRDARGQLLAALGGYLQAVRADPATWRLVLMPPEGAPPVLRDRIASGRSAVVAHLADAVAPALGGGRRSPDPELTALMLSALADDAARLLLTAPDRYSVERILATADWFLGRLTAA